MFKRRWSVFSALCVLTLVLLTPGLMVVPRASAAPAIPRSRVQPTPTSNPSSLPPRVIHISRAQAAPGDVINVTGTGFAAGETVTVAIDVYVDGTLQHVQVTVPASASGGLVANLTIPEKAAPGSYRVTVSTAQGQVGASHLAVLPAAFVSAPAPVGVTPVAAGRYFYVKGAGYPGGEYLRVTASFKLQDGTDAVVVRTVHVAGNGTFEIGLQTPSQAQRGPASVRVQGAVNRDEYAHLRVVPSSVLHAGSVSPSVDVVAGRSFYVSGDGYQPNETIKLSIAFPRYSNSTTVITKLIAADNNGAFSATLIRVPQYATRGTATLTATGQTSKKQATVAATVSYHPAITLAPATSRPGSTVTVSGTGYLPNATVRLSITFHRRALPDLTVNKDVATDAVGSFHTTLLVPAEATPGTYTVTAVGRVSGISASAQLHTSLQPAITITPGTVAPGQTVAIRGAGYSSNVSVTVTANFVLYGGGNKTVTTTVQTNGAGDFSTNLVVPGHAAAGNTVVTAKGPNAQSGVRLVIQHIVAKIVVTPANAAPGSMVTIQGSGYPAGDTIDIQLSIRLTDGSTRILTATAHAGPQGRFGLTIQLPATAAVGAYTITAQSRSTGRAPTAHLTLSVSAHLYIQPTSARPGHAIEVKGDGFSINAPVTISANFPLYGGGNKTVLVTVHTNAQGGFTVGLPIPNRAAAGTVSVAALGPNGHSATILSVQPLGAAITVSPAAALPGGNVLVHGFSYLPNAHIAITVTLTTTSGASTSVTATATTDNAGAFNATLHVPGNAAGGAYTVTARSESSGRAPHARLTVTTLKPSVVAVPSTAAPGTEITVNGFGFAAGESVKVSLAGNQVGTATTNTSGAFTLKVTVPANTASGNYTVSATGNGGRTAGISLAVNRAVSTHYYFPSLYTGRNYSEALAFLNPSAIQARVTITYERTNGSTLPKTIVIAAHSRFTENVNADLGALVSASAAIASDVPVVVERSVLHSIDGAIGPGVTSPATSWYFANGNTTGRYREYIAIQNPNQAQIQVAVHFLPTHHAAFTINRTLLPTSRLTIKVNSFVVHDAVGVILTSSAPIVANRTIFDRHGMTSKIGVTAPQRTWYFAAGPTNPAAHHWIGAINPNDTASYVTVHAYGPFGQEFGTTHGWLKAHGRVGYLMNHLAHRTDVAVVLTASRPIIAEQTTYVGRMHDAATDTFGITTPGKAWGFAAVNTIAGQTDFLQLFNPNLAPAPIVVQFMTTAGVVTQRTYIVGPLMHQQIDVGSVQPNARLGIVAASDVPFVALNRHFTSDRLGSMTSAGTRL